MFNKSLPVFLAIALPIIFFWNNLFFTAVNYTPTVGTNDLTDFSYPYRHFLIESFKQKQLPLWNSDISSGFPIFAEGPIGGLYPLNWLFVLVNPLLSLHLTIVVSYMILFLFSYLYLRKIKLDMLPALFGTIIIVFGGYTANEFIHFPILVSLYLFFIQLLLLETLIQKKGKGLILIIFMGITFGLQILGGHSQNTFYCLLFLFSYWLVFWFINQLSWFRFVIYATLMLIIGLGLGAGQILPTVEYMAQSTRSAGLSVESIGRYSLPFVQITTLINPFATFNPDHTLEAFSHNGWPWDEEYIYMGILALVFAFLGIIQIFNQRQRDEFKRYGYFFLIVGTVFLLLSFGTNFTLGYIFTVPPFSFFRLPFKMVYAFNISLGILAGYGFGELFEWLRNKKIDKKILYGIVILFCLIVYADLYYNIKKIYPETNGNIWYQTPEVVPFLKNKLRDHERITSQFYYYPTLKIFLDKPDLWTNNQIFVNLRNLLPSYNNVLHAIPSNVGAANSGALKIKRYNDLEMEIFYGGIRYSDDLSKADVSDAFLFLNRLMGVRYILTTHKLINEILVKAYQTHFKTGQDQVYVYEFTDYYPRTFMVPKAEKASPEEIKKHLLKGDFSPKDKVFVEEDVNWGAQGGYAATALFQKYTNQEVIISAQASGDGFLFLSDTYYPGWKAYVDGKESKIYRADYAFRAVAVPQGQHIVRFSFEPESFWLGLKVTLATVLLTLVSIIGLLVIRVIRH